MTRQENPTYRDTRRCANCHWVTFRDFGHMRGHYCTRYEQRCCKTKVCDNHMTEEEYEVCTQWPDNLAEYWADELKVIIPKQ